MERFPKAIAFHWGAPIIKLRLVIYRISTVCGVIYLFVCLLQNGWHRVANTRGARRHQFGQAETADQIWRTSHFRVSYSDCYGNQRKSAVLLSLTIVTKRMDSYYQH